VFLLVIHRRGTEFTEVAQRLKVILWLFDDSNDDAWRWIDVQTIK
jgi:hypothetical protein